METETSSFETSEILAAFLASKPLLSESWRLCSAVNTAQPGPSIAVEQIGSVCYVAFSALQMVPSIGSCDLVPLEIAGHGLFCPLCRRNNEEEEPVKVDAGMLSIFLSMYPSIQSQIGAAMERSKSIVITGHSIGGTIASLSVLWLLSYLQTIPSNKFQVLCITFGSPLLGNERLSKAILRQRWGGNFCHVVSIHDMMPRLLFAPLSSFITPYIHELLQYWTFAIANPELANPALQFPCEQKAAIFSSVLACIEDGSIRSRFWPFGSYMFCSAKGAICMDNAASVTKMMHLLLKTGSPTSSIEDHLRYGEYIGELSVRLFRARSSSSANLTDSSYDVGVISALESLGITNQELVAGQAKECLEMARRVGRTPNLRSAELAIKLSRILPCRLEVQWYKEWCDASDDQLGYYDVFKRGSLRKDFRVNIDRIKLANFWDEVIKMMENNQLPCDFERRGKWVNGSQFYKLLVEPLDIADFYKNRKPHEKGRHYMTHGRARRYEIFDRWWKDREVTGEENYARSTFASATQDSCFWAKVEEARECLDDIRKERDTNKRALLWESIILFEKYAKGLVDRKEVSIDVLARNSSYSLWVADLKEFKSQLPETELPRIRGC